MRRKGRCENRSRGIYGNGSFRKPQNRGYQNAIGGAYALLAAKEIGFNYTIAFSDATIAPLSSDQAVNFYDEKLSDNPQKDKEELKAKYTFAEGNPFKAAKDGYIDAVIDAREVKPYVASALSMLL